MYRSDTRILTSHTGSLPRPQALVQLYMRKNRGEVVDCGAGRGGARRAQDRQRGCGQ